MHRQQKRPRSVWGRPPKTKPIKPMVKRPRGRPRAQKPSTIPKKLRRPKQVQADEPRARRNPEADPEFMHLEPFQNQTIPTTLRSIIVR